MKGYQIKSRLDKSLRLLFLVIFFGGLSLNTIPTVSAVSTDLVISQVYGGGGNSGATYTNDFIEIFNRGSAGVSLTGYQVQYFAPNGNSGGSTTLTSLTLSAGQYYLIQEAQGTGGTTPLPSPDQTGTLSMGGTAGSVKLLNSSSTVIDTVGYGSTATVREGTPAPAPSNTTAVFRASSGCTDSDNNSADFTTGVPAPRNTSTALHSCAPIQTNPSGTGTASPGTVAPGAQVTLSVNVTPGTNPASTGLTVTADLTSIGGSATQAFSGSGNTFTYLATVAGGTSEGVKSLPFTIQDNETRTGTGTISLSINNLGLCGGTFTHTYEVQGTTETSPLNGQTNVVVQGVVVGDFEGASPALRGFFIQDETGDSDATTSDGLFVFNGNNDSVSAGQVVRVTGTVSEYQGQTQITANSGGVESCERTATITPTDVNLPFASATYPERFEGMLVRLPQTLYVTETYQLGRFGQILMSSGDRLRQPTQLSDPGGPAQTLQAANDLNQIIIDDSLQSQNPDPIIFGRGTSPLSASNTLREGDTATNITGILNYTWAGNAASPNAYRVRPTVQPDFQATNQRPTEPENIGGTLRVAGLNLLNFFNTYTGCTYGVGGAAADCRGADNQTEFDRQVAKTLAAVEATQADVIAFSEIENDGYGPSSAIVDLVTRLNTAEGAGTYAFIDADAATGQTNALGTDAIKVGIIYKPGKVTPVGNTAVLNTGAFGLFQITGSDPQGRSRPALAQTFKQNSNNEQFTVVANHLKSKGSACDNNISPVGPDPDTGDLQGNCNLTRKQAAQEEVTWLATNPTGIADPDILIMGDMNSYAKEDPIKAFENGGYTNLIASKIGQNAYSYVFDGQSGYLDHALGSPGLSSQVSGVTEFHNNADEPTALDYNTDFKSAGQISSLYAVDPFRASDHDPVLVGLNLTTVCDPLVVTSSTDDGTDTCGTLSGAINQAKALSSSQAMAITFLVGTIALSGSLPTITSLQPANPLTIGPSCSTVASSPGSRVQIVPGGQNVPGTALTIGSNVILQGFTVTGFSTSAITVIGANNTIACSRVGTADGTTATANGIGIDLQGSNNNLGLVNQADTGNQVAGNSGIGIYVEGTSSNNYAYYNLVGLQSDGTTSLKNGGGGIKVDSGGQLKFGPGNKIKA